MTFPVQVRAVSKSFGSNEVLSGIDLSFEAGRITALMGANGAGKSTLIKILAGVYAPDAGELLVDGEPATMNSPLVAREYGIETVHQRIDEGVIPGLTVAENLVFDRLAQNEVPRVMSLRKLVPRAREVAAALQLDWSDEQLRKDVFDIGIADQQLVMLARAVSRQPKLLILDEPTSALSAAEAQRLFAVVRQLRDAGVAIVYVSHRLSEVDSLADRVVVIRDGVVRGDQVPPFDWREALTDMLGSQVLVELEQHSEFRGEQVVLEMTDVTLFPDRAPFDLQVREGEVTGVIGLLGSGKSELANGIFGAQGFVSGQMTLDGEAFAPRGPHEAVRAGVYLVPEDRVKQSMLPGWSLARVVSLPFLKKVSSLGVISRAHETEAGGSVIEEFGVVARSAGQDIDSLSGGNQQKVVVGRWMRGAPRMMLLDEPFRGVDIGARRDISRRARALAQSGVAVMVLSSDIDEILEVADRILVLVDGSVRLDAYSTQTDREVIVTTMSEVA